MCNKTFGIQTGLFIHWQVFFLLAYTLIWWFWVGVMWWHYFAYGCASFHTVKSLKFNFWMEMKVHTECLYALEQTAEWPPWSDKHYFHMREPKVDPVACQMGLYAHPPLAAESQWLIIVLQMKCCRTPQKKWGRYHGGPLQKCWVAIQARGVHTHYIHTETKVMQK